MVCAVKRVVAGLTDGKGWPGLVALLAVSDEPLAASSPKSMSAMTNVCTLSHNQHHSKKTIIQAPYMIAG